MLGLVEQVDAGGNRTHPYVGLAIALAAGAVFWGVFEWCVARALLLFAESTALTHGVPLGEPASGSTEGGGPFEHMASTSSDERQPKTLPDDLIPVEVVAEILGMPVRKARRRMSLLDAPNPAVTSFGRGELWSQAEVRAWMDSRNAS
jgi:predicted DNA-binding transcriptional regulator AlpA